MSGSDGKYGPAVGLYKRLFARHYHEALSRRAAQAGIEAEFRVGSAERIELPASVSPHIVGEALR